MEIRFKFQCCETDFGALRRICLCSNEEYARGYRVREFATAESLMEQNQIRATSSMPTVAAAIQRTLQGGEVKRYPSS